MAVATRLRSLRQRFAPARRARRTLSVGAGLVIAVAAVLAAGEAYLRLAPPGDVSVYLEGRDRTGPFRTDPRYGVQYRSFDALAADNHPAIFDFYRPLFDGRTSARSWAFFGSSFVQAPGMLADTARVFVPQRFTFNLGKNEQFPVRFAQA